MHIDNENLYNSIKESFGRMSYIKPSDVPKIDLYMDQVTLFMDEHLKASVRNPSEERVMTKTMINNYVKNEVFPAPVKKKYSDEHIFVLIFIYYMKSILQINDIKKLLDPILSGHFGKDGEISMEDVYTEVFKNKDEELKRITEDVLSKYQESMKTFEDASDEDRENLRLFDFVCRLSAEIFVKKLLVEKIVDGMKDSSSNGKGKDKAKEEV